LAAKQAVGLAIWQGSEPSAASLNIAKERRMSGKRKFSLLMLAVVTALIPLSASANITYLIDVTAGVGSVTGTVTTDGATGILGAGDFLAWNLTLNGNGGVSTTITSADSGAAAFVQGADTTATASALSFNYSGLDNGYLLFQDNLFSGHTYWCNAVSIGACFQGVSIAPQAYSDPSFVTVAVSGIQIIGVAPGPVPGAGLASLAALTLAGLYARTRRA
jgi:hypothetical protein